MPRSSWMLIVLVAIVVSCNIGRNRDPNVLTTVDAIADGETASAIAQLVLRSTLHQESIDLYKPYVVKLENDTWVVRGTMPTSSDSARFAGELPVVVLSKKDARVIRIFFTCC